MATSSSSSTTISSSSISSGSEVAGRLRCSFQHPSKRQSQNDKNISNDDAAGEEESTSSSFLWFRPNQGKRSSFLLDLKTDDQQESGSSYHVIPETPCHCYVECVMNQHPSNSSSSSNSKDFFFLGGFQLISTARSVEVYVTRKDNDQEELLMTCRGIPIRDKTANNLSDCFKVFSVVPGGARPVTLLRLCLKSEEKSGDQNGSSSSSTKLVSIQLTGRIPDPQQQQQPQEKSDQPQQAQITPSSSAMMMQQMQMMMSAGGPSSTPTNLFSAATPLASGSSQRNPFFAPQSASPAAAASNRPPPTPQQQQNSQQSYTRNINNSSNNSSTEAIMAGVSFMVRTEGQATVQLLQNEMEKHTNQVQHQMQNMEQRLQQQQAILESLVNQQQTMMQKQYDMMLLLQQQQQQLQWLVMASSNSQQQQQQQQKQQKHDLDPKPSVIVCEEAEEQSPTSPLESTTAVHHSSDVNFPTESSYDPTCRITLSEDGEESLPVNKQTSSASKMGNLPRLGMISEDDKNETAKETSTTSAEKDDHAQEGETQEEYLVLSEEENGLVPRYKDKDDDEGNGSGGNVDDNKQNESNGDEIHNGGRDEQQKKASQEEGNSSKQTRQNDKEQDATNYPNPFLSDEDEAEAHNPEETSYHGDDDDAAEDADDEHTENSTNDDRDSIMQKQLVFVDSKKGIFPSPPRAFKEERPKKEITTSNSHDIEEKHTYGSIKQDSSMLDHWSIHVGNGTVSTGLSSLPPGESMTIPSVDQAESIEVLAVFPDSPTGEEGSQNPSPISATTTINSDQTPGGYSSAFQQSHNTLSNDARDFYSVGIDDEDEEGNFIDGYGGDSYDGDEEKDLVSVSLAETENVNPTPRHNFGHNKSQPAANQPLRHELGKGPQQTPKRESVFFS